MVFDSGGFKIHFENPGFWSRFLGFSSQKQVLTVFSEVFPFVRVLVFGETNAPRGFLKILVVLRGGKSTVNFEDF